MAGARTQTELAKRLGVVQPAVSKYVRDATWPVKRRGPWSAGEVNKIEEWYHSKNASRSPESAITGEAAQLQRLKLQSEILLKQEQRKTYQLKREMLERERVTIEQYEGALGGLAEMFVKEVEGLRLTLVQRFSGVDPASLDDVLDSILGRLANTTEIKAVEVEAAVASARRKRRGRNTKAA